MTTRVLRVQNFSEIMGRVLLRELGLLKQTDALWGALGEQLETDNSGTILLSELLWSCILVRFGRVLNWANCAHWPML